MTELNIKYEIKDNIAHYECPNCGRKRRVDFDWLIREHIKKKGDLCKIYEDWTNEEYRMHDGGRK